MMTPEEEQAEYEEWLRSRPESVQVVIKAKPPTTCYTLTTTGQHAFIYSYGEDGTVSILTTMLDLLPVRVFDVDPDDLVVCHCRTAGLN